MSSDPIQASLTVHTDQGQGVINRNIYGQFAEHLGRSIYEGLWVGEDSPIPNTRGIRNDVVAALKTLQVPVLRWPGGCFADEYHWTDGVGPRDMRVPMVNTNWGGVKETNQFGTHEFFDLCEQVGCEPYICGNLGSGSVQEMSAWVEYMTSAADSPLANQRRANGRQEPWKLKYFSVGNESWGCGGHMRPEFYADNFRRYNVFLKNQPHNHLERIACGPNSDNYAWTDTVMSLAGSSMNGLSMHYYTVPTGNWANKGNAYGFPEAGVVRRPLPGAPHRRVDRQALGDHGQVRPETEGRPRRGRVGQLVQSRAGHQTPASLYQQNTLRDAVSARR